MLDYKKILNSHYIFDIKYINVDGVDDYKIRDLLTRYNKIEKEYEGLFNPEIKNLKAIINKRNDVFIEKEKKAKEFDEYCEFLLKHKKSILYLQDNIKITFENGLVHSLDSPAIIQFNGHYEYYIKGYKLTHYEWLKNPLVRLAKIKNIINA